MIIINFVFFLFFLGLLIIATLLVVGVFCQEDAVEESLEKVEEEVAKNETKSKKERSKYSTA